LTPAMRHKHRDLMKIAIIGLLSWYFQETILSSDIIKDIIGFFRDLLILHCLYYTIHETAEMWINAENIQYIKTVIFSMFSKKGFTNPHRRRSLVNFRGHDIFARKCQNFTQ